ncbi:hypothetical protein CHS0354_038486 [Potamilus streckersoni]|uniref:B30.2/SPRY domain-containing protein n=1 Tax=Potamilus streckersoni TaxID=2493646 RepID=A0AAE0VPZ4_9BIVA|nr:hypothetical protein CHS0354_038486 [Potamilus streckersoni]
MGERYKGKDITPDSGTDPRPNSRVKVVSYEDPFTFQLLQRIFQDQCLSSEAGAIGTEKALTLQNLPSVLDRAADETVSQKFVKHEKTPKRIGPAEVVFDISANVGTLVVEPNRLGLKSHSNFSTMRANCCVYQGKWLYELMLGSKGVMQLGWCTIKCKFSQEEGVGDTPDSYAYDGSRVRKWNVKTQRYGEAWLTGDVITCTIDCDNGIITFYRNGKCLGEAFNNVKVGKGYAYFPAVSLSPSENVCANFGATPLQYPLQLFIFIS